ncbi:kelch-like protein 11 isoform X3 [Aquila chrysaetos chrysaetos]|uniref:kelch-like protein 11 isoform X3 n=1 Tax=Aquila chrysaetos chrysaetos TaxID=223781 RepID=UPI001B7D4339|nr:kelch-like protein 11 isoform X3 [Aquila chrysaetos chrysaetos]
MPPPAPIHPRAPAAILPAAAAPPPRQGAALRTSRGGRRHPARRRRGRKPAMSDKMAAAAASSQPQPSPGPPEAEGGEAEAEEFGCPAHCSDLVWRQNEQRRHGLYCDITLAFGGGRPGTVREYRAHRSVLAAATEYFTPLLSGGFAESRSGRVELQKWSSEGGPDPDTVEAIVGFMYTGTIRVSPGNVHEVLEMADRFLLTRLKEFCGEFLKKKLNLSNCVAIHSLAHMYSLNQLALKAQDMIRRNFHKVIQDEEFYILPFHLVRDWLSDSEITVDSEEVLFETVLKWVQKNPEERERYFEDLFKLLRLSQMKPTYLTRHVKSERLVSSNEACVKLVSEAVESHALRSEILQSAF